jgi:hypothetical protein
MRMVTDFSRHILNVVEGSLKQLEDVISFDLIRN